MEVIGRVRGLRRYNGQDFDRETRIGMEYEYVHYAFDEFMQEHDLCEELKDVEDPVLGEYMMQKHPRWYELISIHTINLSDLQKPSKTDNQKLKTIKVFLIFDDENDKK